MVGRATLQLSLLFVLLAFASAQSFARCRVFTSIYDGHDEKSAANSGYAYKANVTHLELEPDYESIPGGERSLAPDAGGCELEAYPHASLNRSFILNAKRPFLILDAPAWGGAEHWTAEHMATEHGNSVFTVGRSGQKTVGELLQQGGKYHTGQVNQPGDCYHDGVDWPDCGPGKDVTDCSHVPTLFHRQFSPFLQSHMGDISIPDYLQPMRALQMAFSNGTGTGVRPEEHPSAWWANIRGVKRWLFHPPNDRGAPDLFTSRPSCTPRFRLTTTTHCDQPAGSIMWVPSGWVHETCQLDDFSVGIGAISFDGADKPPPRTGPCPSNEFGSEYTTEEVPYCQREKCTSLQTYKH